MGEQLDLADAPVTAPPAPDPWPVMREAHPGKPIARRIFVDDGKQEWVLLEGELAEFYDGATMFVYAQSHAEKSTPADAAEIVDQFNRLWHEEPHRERRA